MKAEREHRLSWLAETPPSAVSNWYGFVMPSTFLMLGIVSSFAWVALLGRCVLKLAL